MCTTWDTTWCDKQECWPIAAFPATSENFLDHMGYVSETYMENRNVGPVYDLKVCHSHSSTRPECVHTFFSVNRKLKVSFPSTRENRTYGRRGGRRSEGSDSTLGAGA